MKYFLSLFLFFIFPVFSQTVVCIHGFMRTHKAMAIMEKSLKKEGYTVYNWSYPSRKKTIEEHASDLNRFLNQIVIFAPDEPVYFVTHSMGGIILRSAIAQNGCPSQAKKGKAVLIAPPNQGTSFGRKLGKYSWIRKYVGNKSGSQLLDSPSFSHIGEFPQEMQILIIAGTFGFNPLTKRPNDGKVSVEETCLATKHDHRILFASHSWIASSIGAIRSVKNFFEKPL